MKYLSVIIILLLLCCPSWSQVFWQRAVTNYSKQQYLSGNQNWQVSQLGNGWMYFANNKGLLEFDGVYWNTYPLQHEAKARAVEAVGGYQTKYFPEDYFLWVKMLMNGCKFYNIQDSLVWFRYDPDTYKRRGGWKYAHDEAITQLNIHKLGYTSLAVMIENIIIRSCVRLIPNELRGLVYKKFLRK